MDVNKVVLLTARLGGIDKMVKHEDQSVNFDYYQFDDENFPLRKKAMTPRLQAKIPKFFGWQLRPGYDYYMWIDGNLILSHSDTVKVFLDNCKGYDIVVVKHPKRPNIRQEARYLRKGLREQSKYLIGRYEGEWTPDQIKEIQEMMRHDDDLLVLGGIFMYRPTKKIQEFMKQWWYFTTRYSVFDQISFSYLLKADGLKIKVLEIVEGNMDSPYFKHIKHKHRDK